MNDVVGADELLHVEEKVVFADSGYLGAYKRPGAKQDVTWHVAMRPGSRKPHEKTRKVGDPVDQIEHLKASLRAKGGHPLRVIKRQFGQVKVRYRGLTKSTAQLNTLFALSNLWMARRKLMALQAQVIR